MQELSSFDVNYVSGGGSLVDDLAAGALAGGIAGAIVGGPVGALDGLIVGGALGGIFHIYRSVTDHR
jgi:uncharacterized protein YcfJ